MELDNSGVEHEQNFWREFVQTERFKNNWVKDQINPELRQCVVDFINKLTDEGSKDVLDVGSGPVSILHGLDGIYITTADPLGKFYESIIDYKDWGHLPPISEPAETLYNRFSRTFDIVHISNALDHTKDPGAAFDSLYACVREGGYLIIQGFENEAVHENWQGFHQWNMTLKGNDLIITGRGIEYVMSQYETVISTTIYLPEIQRNWIVWIVKK